MMRVALLVLLAVASPAEAQVPGVCPLGQAFILGKCYDPSGPGNRTVFHGPWGTAYTVGPGAVERLTTRGKTVRTSQGEFESTLGPDGRYALGPTGRTGTAIQVDPRGLDFQIVVGARRFEIVRAGSGFTLRENNTTVLAYANTPSRMTVTGPKGEVSVSRSPDGSTTVESAAGKTVLPSTLLTNRTRTGPALSAHPHLGRLARFEVAGAGVSIDLWAIAGFAPGAGEMSELLLWETAFSTRP